MKILLHEIHDEEKTLIFSQDDKWLSAIVCEADEKPLSNQETIINPKRNINARVSFRRLEDIYILNGSISTEINLICSLCAENFLQPSKIKFSTFFSDDPEMAGVAYMGKDGPCGKSSGKQNQHAELINNEIYVSKAELESENSEVIYLNENFIDLSEVFQEQLLLAIPVRPLCKKDCMGICSSCGTDLNQSSCKCKEVAVNSPFVALRDLKITKGTKNN